MRRSRWSRAVAVGGAAAVVVVAVAFHEPPETPSELLAEVDVCAVADLTPLGDWSATLWEEEPSRYVPDSPDKAADGCLFSMRTPDGRSTHLRVESTVYESINGAEEGYEVLALFEASLRHLPYHDHLMDPVDDWTGAGDEATAFHKTSTIDDTLSYHEYAVVVRSDDLVVEAHLGLESATPIPDGDLAAPVREVVADTIAAMPPEPVPAPRAERAMAYDHTGVDLCEGTELAPLLDGLEMVKDEARSGDRDVFEARCTFEFTREDPPPYERAHMTVTAAADELVSWAEEAFEREGRGAAGSESEFDDVDGIGDRAKESVSDREYHLYALHGNLVVSFEIRLVAGFLEEVQADVPVEVGRDIVRDTLALVPLLPNHD